MSEPLGDALRKRFPMPLTAVSHAEELAKAVGDGDAVVFADATTLPSIARLAARSRDHSVPGHIVAICDGPLTSAVGWMPEYPWLSHVIGVGMLDHPMVAEHLPNVVTALGNSGHRLLDWLGPDIAGRRIRITSSNRRVERVERMGEFFLEAGVSERTVQQLRDATDELLTNAFYDAPYAAGAAKRPIPRTSDVTLPEDTACDMVYGCSDTLAVVRVRDPFGSLSRTRITEVLTRCARGEMQVEVDASMGGAGLGLWRVFAAASFVAISVVGHHHTDVLIGIAKRGGQGPRPFAFHLFFKEGAQQRYWQLLHDDTDCESVSITVATE